MKKICSKNSIRQLPLILTALAVLIAMVMAVITRTTIYTYTFDNLMSDAADYLYYPYNDLEYANGAYKDISDLDTLTSESQYIISGTVTGEREILEECVKTTVTVRQIYKGEQVYEKIVIYEPVGVEKAEKFMTSFGGYNFLKENETYLFFLNETDKAGEMLYVTPAYGSLPESDEEAVYSIVEIEHEGIVYGDYMLTERFFLTDSDKEKYMSIYKSAMAEYSI